MDISSIMVILVGIICMVLGFFASVLLNTLRDDGISSEEQLQAPPGGRKGKYSPVARLWREKKSGSLLLEVDGKTLIGPGPLSDLQRNELEQAARDFRTWLGMGLSTGAGSQYRVSTSTEGNSLPEPVHNGNVKGSEPGASGISSNSSPNPISNQPVLLRPSDPIKPGIPETSINITSEKSIVLQIEDILQDMIAGGPYDKKGLHLIEDPLRGVIVTVENDRFEGIDSVPYPEIKAILRSAVVAWEKK